MDLQDAIVQNSISINPADNSMVVLKSENEILQNQLLHLQEAAAITKRSRVSVSKNAFKGAIALIGLLTILSAYSLLSKRTVYYPLQPYTMRTHYVPFVLLYPQSIVAAQHARIVDSIDKANRQKAIIEAKRKKELKKKSFWDFLKTL
jgi:hypothetical protein